MKAKPLNKSAASAMLSALVDMHIEHGGMIKSVDAQIVPPSKNFNFNALNKSRNCGAGRGGKMHNAGVPRVI